MSLECFLGPCCRSCFFSFCLCELFFQMCFFLGNVWRFIFRIRRSVRNIGCLGRVNKSRLARSLLGLWYYSCGKRRLKKNLFIPIFFFLRERFWLGLICNVCLGSIACLVDVLIWDKKRFEKMHEHKV